MKISYLLLLVLAVASCSKTNSSNTSGDNHYLKGLSNEKGIEYFLLSEKRNQIEFPSMSNEDRKTIVAQARVVLGQLYVNRLKKIEDFGVQVDPLPQLDNFENDYMNASLPVFHEQMSKIFISQKDFHTWYNYPAPMGCYTSFLPFAVAPAINSNNQYVSVVKAIRNKPEIYNLAPQLKLINVGDVLLTVNKKTADIAMDELSNLNSGANPPALRRSANSLLTYRSQNSLPMPKEDVAVLEFKKMNGSTYKVTIPWLIYGSPTCLSGEDKDSGKISSGENRSLNEYEEFYRTKKSDLLTIKHSVDDKTFKLRNTETLSATMTDTTDTTIHWWSFENTNGKFGVIRLDSFTPSVGTVEAKKIIINLMNNQMANFDGIIFDLRNNGGGQINYGQGLAELITGKTLDVLKFQLLTSEANNYYLSRVDSNSDFYTLLQESLANGWPMTRAIPLQSAENIFTAGQYFFKPVAIFTNSSCYSTCDMMSALFQDQGLAEIWAEDMQTGAGGANNTNLNNLISSLGKKDLGPFQKLPNGQNMGFAYRQVVRTGSHAGEILENAGVKPDYLAETSIQDIVTNGKSQFERISASLAAKKDKYLSWVNFNKNYSGDTSDENLNLILDYRKTDKIQIFNGKVKIKEVYTANLLETQTTSIAVPTDSFTSNNADLEIIGFSLGERTWRKITHVRKIPKPKVLTADEIFTLDFKDGITPYAIFDVTKTNAKGWFIQDGELKIGDAAGYNDDINSTASFFIDLKNKDAAFLTFELEGMTEPNYDFVSVEIVAGNQKYELVKPTSGEIENQGYNVDLQGLKGRSFELRFNFSADEGGNDRGITVKNLQIK